MRLVVSVVYMAVVVLSAGLSPNSAFAQDATDTKPATIWYREQFIFHSKSLERDFLIQVAKPLRSQTSKVSVIYVLDGNSLFPAVASMMQGYGGFGHSAPASVVGIGYPDQTLEQWFSLRTHDLLSGPVPDSVKEVPNSFKAAAASGNGAGFAKFLLQELRPMIERRYPVDPHQSILAGHSLGASFASHVLLHDSGAFDDYLLCSPEHLDRTAVTRQGIDISCSEPSQGLHRRRDQRRRRFRRRAHVAERPRARGTIAEPYISGRCEISRLRRQKPWHRLT